MPERLDVGQVLTAVFDHYRNQFGLLFPAALIVFLPVAVINSAIGTGAGANLILVVLSAAVGVIATYWYQGMVVEAVRDIQDRVRDFSLGGLFRSVGPVVAPLIGAGILGGLGIALGLVLLIVPGLVLLTWWALLAPVIVIERTGVIDAFGRSRALVRGNGWQVFGVIVVLFLLQAIASGILQAIGRVLSDSVVAFAIATLIGNAVVAPLTALAAATMFLEVKRIRGEPPVPAGAEPGAPPTGTPSPAGPAPEPTPPPAPQGRPQPGPEAAPPRTPESGPPGGQGPSAGG